MSVEAAAIIRGTTTPAAPAASLLEYLHACPICGSADLRHYCRVPSLFNAGEFIRYERCRGCGTVLRNPRVPPQARLERYEESELSESWKRLDPRNQRHYAHMMRALARLHPGPGRALLDFGCGAGGFLLEGKAAGFTVSGLELNRSLAAHVTREYGIPVFQGLIDDSRFAGTTFDVIVSSQVFEHLLDPRDTLRKVLAHLQPGGLLLIEVPNLRHVKERIRRGSTMDDSHLFYFTADSLAGMMRAEGLRIVTVEEGLRPYRVLGSAAARLPDGLHAAGERILSALQIKTALSVIGRKDDQALVQPCA